MSTVIYFVVAGAVGFIAYMLLIIHEEKFNATLYYTRREIDGVDRFLLGSLGAMIGSAWPVTLSLGILAYLFLLGEKKLRPLINYILRPISKD